MVQVLAQLKGYIQQQYELLYVQPGWQFPDHPQLGQRSPVWLWQGADLHRVSTLEQATGAALLDPEIGLCLYFQIYNAEIPVRQQLSRALQIRSSLLPVSRRQKDAQPDSLGTWRVALHWLVEESEFPSWITEVAEIREQTAHFEEIPVDAIMARNGNWIDALRDHAIPRLLFRVRSILRKEDAALVERWQSADYFISESISQIGDLFSEPVTRECAAEVVSYLFHRKGQDSVPQIKEQSEPLDLTKLTIENFRNIDRLSIDFRSPQSNSEATVVQGPNGSGKSSVFEALCIAVANASPRYETYINDKNRHMFGRQNDYASDYLRNLNTGDRAACIALNSSELRPVRLAPEGDVPNIVQQLGGTFLSQEASRSFVRMTATELGGEIAAGLSAVAGGVSDFVDSRFRSAQDQLRDFNSRWGLRVNVVKRDTVIAQVAQRDIESALPNLSEIIAWLSSDLLSKMPFANQARLLSERCRIWQEQTANVVSAIAKDVNSQTSNRVVAEHVAALNSLIENTGALYSLIADRTRRWSPVDGDKLRQWGLWLQRQKESSHASDDQEMTKLRDEERSINVALANLTESGRLIAEREKHIENVMVFISQWSHKHADICPICDSDVANRGGIETVVKNLSASLGELLKQSRAEFTELRDTLKNITAQLHSLGGGAPPIGADDRSRIVEEFSWLLPDRPDFVDVVSDQERLERLLVQIQHFQSRPNLPTIRSNPEELANTLCKRWERVSLEHDQVSRLPDAWKEVQREVRRRLAAVTATHLPRTLEALWLEIAKNVMPAAWQQAGRLEFRTGARQEPEASVVIRTGSRTVLASHILNGAEVHNLGLAWFFAKYLTRGRFQYKFLVLDDPADTMDQPTFRDLCRFLETLLRLHRVYSIPLSLVVLLHEDQRALDTARATGAVLYQLRWNRHTKSINKPLRVYGEQMNPPLPISVLEAS